MLTWIKNLIEDLKLFLSAPVDTWSDPSLLIGGEPEKKTIEELGKAWQRPSLPLRKYEDQIDNTGDKDKE